MSYDSAVLINIENQESVTKESLLQFAEWMSKNNFLPVTGSIKNDERPAIIQYYFYDHDTDEEDEETVEIKGIETIEEFISSKNIEFVSLDIEGGNKELEVEFDKLLEELDKNDASYLCRAWKFGYGFGNVADPVAGVREGWSFYIKTSGYVPDFELLDEVFSKGLIIKKVRSAVEQIFKSKTKIIGCLTG
jgi:hypothetical protein